jgi:hypothetical protein
MALLNAVLRPAFDVLLSPFRSLPALVSIAVFSLAVSILMLLVFKRTSNQARLADVKRRIHAGLFEIRLFSDDLRAIFRAQGEILRANARYLGLSLVPMLWILPPLVLVMAQLQFHYGYTGLVAGQRAVVTADLRDAGPLRPDATLEAPAGLRVETPALWIPGKQQVAWRVAAEREGDYTLTLRLGDAPPVTKSLTVSRAVRRRSPERVTAGFVDELLYPAEAALPATAPFRSIRINYPEAAVDVFGHRLHWMIPFFALSIVFAFALRGVFKVTI